jgi:hypothetical protein
MKLGPTLLAGLVLCSSLALPISAQAVQVKHRKAKAIAAGVAAYEIAKHTGKNKAHKNFMQRHPMLTGIAAAAAVNHHLKKKEKKHH